MVGADVSSVAAKHARGELMATYWLMFWLPLLGVLSPRRLMDKQARVMLAVVCAVLALFIGLRDEVGGDWGTYADQFEFLRDVDFIDALKFNDPFYYGMNWIAAQIGLDIHAVNLVCAAILMAGVFRFCQSLPNPWLALLVAVPYLLIVVGMGYTRQAVALGLVMFGLVSFSRGRTLSFVVCVVIGAMFHKTAALLLPIAGIASSNRRVWSIVWVVAACAMAYYVLLQSESNAMWNVYVTEKVESQGAIERVLMNVVAALPLLRFRHRLLDAPHTRRLWMIFAWLSLACLPIVPFASTAVDRMALYLIPMQLMVFSRMPNLTGNTAARTVMVVGIVLYYATVQAVWLNFAFQRDYWVPYHFMSFID
jgi:hypothetical protein